MLLRGITMLLLLAVILNAFWLISVRYKTRTEYAMLSELQLQADKMNKEYTKLQLEEGTYSSNLVLQDFALRKFGLVQPDKKHILEVR